MGVDLKALRKELGGSSQRLTNPAINTARVHCWILRHGPYREDLEQQLGNISLAALAKLYHLAMADGNFRGGARCRYRTGLSFATIDSRDKKAIGLALDTDDEEPDLIPAKLSECDTHQRVSACERVNLLKENGYRRLLHALGSSY